VSRGRAQRPFLICNMGMFVNVTGSSFPLLAPVQANGLMTGVVGAPANATDANGLAVVGGGGGDSFAFNSTFSSQSGSTATVTQTRQWSLTDIMGTSSAAFAETVQNQIAQWEANPWLFVKWLLEEGDAILKWIESHLPSELHATARDLVARGRSNPAESAAFSFPNPKDLIPQYPSWPAGAAAGNPVANTFADGGSLENNGLASMLAFTDIDSAIVCVNSEIPLTQAQTNVGISDGNGGWIAGTNIIVDGSVPPLFGYQPYDPQKGYVLFSAGGATPEDQLFANTQVFASTEFAGFLTGLWAAAGSASPATAPAILSQSLTVQANTWFGVPTGTTAMTIVWVYLDSRVAPRRHAMTPRRHARRPRHLAPLHLRRLLGAELRFCSIRNSQKVTSGVTFCKYCLRTPPPPFLLTSRRGAATTSRPKRSGPPWAYLSWPSGLRFAASSGAARSPIRIAGSTSSCLQSTAASAACHPSSSSRSSWSTWTRSITSRCSARPSSMALRTIARSRSR